MERRPLTSRQREILDFMESFTREHGYPPTVREICAATGLRSPRSVSQHLQALERKGYIARGRDKSRAIRFLHRNVTANADDLVCLRLEGRAAAGSHGTSEATDSFCLRIDRQLVDGSNSFLLRVEGDSMRGAHIVEGDYIVVDPDPCVEHGDVVVARVGDETTVKRYEARSDGAYLVPEHDGRARMAVAAGGPNVQLIGKVVGLIRRIN